VKKELRSYQKKPSGHVWETDEDGELEIFAYKRGEIHNGPKCVNCGYGFCHHCQELPGRECSGSTVGTTHDP